MSGKIEEILERDDMVFNVLEKNSMDVIAFTQGTHIPKTAKSLFMLVNNILTLKTAIFDLAETGNLYSINVLHRALIEHFLRFNYIWFQSMESKDDSIGIKYHETLFIKEQLDIGKAYQKVSSILTGGPSKTSAWDVLKEFRGDLDKTNPKELEEVAKEFTHKAIVEYVDNRINKEKSPNGNMLLSIIPQYSDLSSFVHGGRLAYESMIQAAKKDNVEQSVDEVIEAAYCMFATAVLLLFLRILQYDLKFEKAYLMVDHAMKAQHGKSPN